MKNTIYFATLVLLSCSAFGQDYSKTQLQAYLVTLGLSADLADGRAAPAQVITYGSGPKIVWNSAQLKGLPAPVLGDLPALEEAEQILADFAVAQEAARQATKPLEQRLYENQFFALTEQLLTGIADERAGQTPPVKLSFPEIDAILEQLFVSDLATATRASIRLLGIDAALKRYNMLWWDDAQTHVIPEE